MKKARTLLILLLVILLLVGGVVLVSVLNREEEPSDTTEETIDYSVLTLADVDPDTIVGFDYIYEGGDVVSLLKNEKWVLVQDDTLPVDQTKVSTLANAMCTVIAKRKVLDDTTDYDQFGLKTPKTQITVKYKDGSDLTFYVGKKAAYAEGTYYVKTSKSDAVYLVSENMLTFFAYTAYQLLSLDTMPDLDVDDLVQIVIENPKNTGLTLVASSDDVDRTWDVTYSGKEPETLDEDTNLPGDLLEAILMLSMDAPVWCTELTEEKRAELGLDEKTTVTLKYTEIVTTSAGESSSSSTTKVERTLTLTLSRLFIEEAETGDEEGEQYAYLLYEPSGYVYRASVEDSMMLFDDFGAEA